MKFGPPQTYVRIVRIFALFSTFPSLSYLTTLSLCLSFSLKVSTSASFLNVPPYSSYFLDWIATNGCHLKYDSLKRSGKKRDGMEESLKGETLLTPYSPSYEEEKLWKRKNRSIQLKSSYFFSCLAVIFMLILYMKYVWKSLLILCWV